MRDVAGNEITEMEGRIEFSAVTPCVQDVPSHVAHALTLGLPEADVGGGALHLIANGPTARDYDFGQAAVDTLAINGALKLFTDRGLAPTYWCACDPQELVALDFLSGDLPEETIYLVASKCHPAVFEQLKHRDVRLWHADDHPLERRQVPSAASATLSALMLAHRLGYRRIDTWGWDCCFSESGEHHAGPGQLGLSPDEITIQIGDPPNAVYFQSTPTWVYEEKDASGILPVLKWCGTNVAIHGRSMISAILPEFAASTPLPILEQQAA